jgi:hypothetical protein
MNKKKSKSAIQERDKPKFNMEPGLKLLLVFFVFIGIVASSSITPAIMVYSILIFWMLSIALYHWGYMFGIKDKEKARRWAVYLLLAGVFLALWEFRVCC